MLVYGCITSCGSRVGWASGLPSVARLRRLYLLALPLLLSCKARSGEQQEAPHRGQHPPALAPAATPFARAAKLALPVAAASGLPPGSEDLEETATEARAAVPQGPCPGQLLGDALVPSTGVWVAVSGWARCVRVRVGGQVMELGW